MKIKTMTLSYFKKHKLRLFLIIILILSVTCIGLLPALLLKEIIDNAIGSNAMDRLLLYCILYSLVFLLIGVVTFLKDKVLLSTSQDILKSIRYEMMQHVHRLEYTSYQALDSGYVDALFGNDMDSIHQLFTSGVINLLIDTCKIIGTLVVLFVYSYLLGLIILGVIPILILIIHCIRVGMLKAQKNTKKLEANVNQKMYEYIMGIEEIKVNHAEETMSDHYNQTLKNHFKHQQSSSFYDGVFPPLMTLIRNIVVVGILLLSGYNQSILGLSVGMIISGISLISDLFSPIEALGMEIQTIQRSVASIKRIDEFMSIKEYTTNEEKMNGYSIELQNVSFGYSKEKLILSNFNLKLDKGDKLTVFGASGVGKSTLMKLILGVLSPIEGEVLIGEKNASMLTNSDRRKLFSILYQDSFFSSDSLIDELTLRDTSIPKEKVEYALKCVGLDFDLEAPFHPLECSSGELALLGLARVLVLDTPILLLDEMNAKIDPITQAKIIDILDNFGKDKIIFSIEHHGKLLKNTKKIVLE